MIGGKSCGTIRSGRSRRGGPSRGDQHGRDEGDTRQLRGRAESAWRIPQLGCPQTVRRGYSAASARASASDGCTSRLSTMSATRRPLVTATAMTEMSSPAWRPDDRTAEHHPCGRVAHDLHEALRVALDQRLGRRREGHLGDPDLAPLGEGFGLGETDVGDLGDREDGRGGLVVVEVAVHLWCASPSRARRSCGPASPPPTRAAASPTGRRRRRCGARWCGSRGRSGCSRPSSTSTPAASSPSPSLLGMEPMASSAWLPLADPPVVAAHDHTVAGAVDADGAGALEQAHATAQELVFERGGDLGVLLRAAPAGATR